MKICIITGFFPPDVIGGGEVYNQRVATELSKNNEVVIITSSKDLSIRPRVEYQSNVKIYRFRPFLLSSGFKKGWAHKIDLIENAVLLLFNMWNLRSFLTIYGILKREMPDIVHISTTGPLSMSAFSAVSFVNLPCICTCHSYSLLSYWPSLYNYRKNKVINELSLPEKMYMQVKRYYTRNVNVATAPSNFVLSMHSKYNFFKKADCIALPLGIDPLEHELNEKNDGNIRFLFVGRLSRTKGVQHLIEAFRKVEIQTNILQIVGTGPDIEIFKRQALGDDRIKFYGFVSESELEEIYMRSHILVVPSVWDEVFGLIILDGFKYGLPVLGSNVGGIPELIKHGDNGYLFERGNVQELSNYIAELSANTEILKRLQQGAKSSMKCYSIKNHIDKLMQLYDICKN